VTQKKHISGDSPNTLEAKRSKRKPFKQALFDDHTQDVYRETNIGRHPAATQLSDKSRSQRYNDTDEDQIRKLYEAIDEKIRG